MTDPSITSGPSGWVSYDGSPKPTFPPEGPTLPLKNYQQRVTPRVPTLPVKQKRFERTETEVSETEMDETNGVSASSGYGYKTDSSVTLPSRQILLDRVLEKFVHIVPRCNDDQVKGLLDYLDSIQK